MENSPKDVSVIQIQAEDPDSSSNEKLTYRITSGNPQNFFAINSKTGKGTLVWPFLSCLSSFYIHQAEACCTLFIYFNVWGTTSPFLGVASEKVSILPGGHSLILADTDMKWSNRN